MALAEAKECCKSKFKLFRDKRQEKRAMKNYISRGLKLSNFNFPTRKTITHKTFTNWHKSFSREHKTWPFFREFNLSFGGIAICYHLTSQKLSLFCFDLCWFASTCPIKCKSLFLLDFCSRKIQCCKNIDTFYRQSEPQWRRKKNETSIEKIYNICRERGWLSLKINLNILLESRDKFDNIFCKT